MNGTTFASGVGGGQAFHFDASQNQGVQIPDNPSLDPTNAITLEAWVKPSSYPNTAPTMEVEGQLISTPEPSSLVMLTVGICTVGWSGWTWRRRKSAPRERSDVSSSLT